MWVDWQAQSLCSPYYLSHMCGESWIFLSFHFWLILPYTFVVLEWVQLFLYFVPHSLQSFGAWSCLFKRSAVPRPICLEGQPGHYLSWRSLLIGDVSEESQETCRPCIMRVRRLVGQVLGDPGDLWAKSYDSDKTCQPQPLKRGFLQ